MTTLKSMTLSQVRNALNAPEGDKGRLELLVSNDKTGRTQAYRIHSASRPHRRTLQGWKAQGIRITGKRGSVRVSLPYNVTSFNTEAREVGGRKSRYARVWHFWHDGTPEMVRETAINVFSLVAAHYGDRDPAPKGALKIDSLFAVDKVRGQQIGWLTTAEDGTMSFQPSAVAEAVARHRKGTDAHIKGFGWLTRIVQREGITFDGIRIERTERCIRCGAILRDRNNFSRSVLMGTGGSFDAAKGHWTSCAGQDPQRFLLMAQATGDARVIKRALVEYAKYTATPAALEPAVMAVVDMAEADSPQVEVEAATTDEERSAQLMLAGKIVATQRDRVERVVEAAQAQVVQDMLADEAAATTKAAAQVGKRLARKADISSSLADEMSKKRPEPAKRIRAGVEEFTAADRELETDDIPWDVNEAIAKDRRAAERFDGLDLD